MLKPKQKTQLIKITAYLYVASFFFNSLLPVQAQEATSPAYSSTHAFNLVGAGDMDGDQFKVDEEGQLVNYTGHLFAENELYPGTREMERNNQGSFLRRFYNASDIMRQRYGHTTTQLSDGRLLLAGGSNGYTTLSSTALYNPSTKSFSQGPEMLQDRTQHTATLLPSGDVVMIGGLSSGAPGRPGDVEGRKALQDGEVYLAKENRFVSLGGYIKYHRPGRGVDFDLSQNVNSEKDLYDILMNSRARHTTALLPGAKELLILGTTPTVRGGPVLDATVISKDPRCTEKNANHYNFQICSEINKQDIPNGDVATLVIKTSAEFRDPSRKKPGLLNNPSALITVEITGPAVILKEGELGKKNLPRRKKHLFKVKPLIEDRSEGKVFIAFPEGEPGTMWAHLVIKSQYPADNTGTFTYQNVILSNNNQPPGKVDPTQPQYSISDVSDIVVYRDPEDYSFASNSELVVGSILRNNSNARAAHISEEPYFQYLLEKQSRATIYATREQDLDDINQIAREHNFEASTKLLNQDLFKEFTPPKHLKSQSFRFAKDADYVIIVPNLPKNQEVEAPDTVVEDSAGIHGEILNLDTGQTTSLPEGVVPSSTPFVYSMANGKVLIAGGGYDWVTLYDPSAKSFTRLEKLTIPRVGYQVLSTLDSTGRLDKLIFLGGLPTTSEAASKMKTLIDSKQLPAEIFDVSTLKWSSPFPRPELVGAFAEMKLNTTELRDNFKCLDKIQFGFNNRPSPNTVLPSEVDCWKQSLSLAQAQGYNMSLITSLWPSFDIATTTVEALSSITNFIPLSDNSYFALTSRGALVLDLENNTVDRLYLPTQFPTASEAENASPLNFHYDTLDEYQTGVGLARVGNNEVLITGGKAAEVKFREPDPRISQAVNNARQFGSAVGLGALTAATVAGALYSPLLGVIGLSFTMIAATMSLISDTAPTPCGIGGQSESLITRSGAGCFSNGESHFYLALTNQYNWLFSEDLYKSLRDSASLPEEERVANEQGFLPPPKEVLRTNPAPADIQRVGPETGAKFVIELEQDTINPYPGAVQRGTVKLVDANGKVVPRNTVIGLTADNNHTQDRPIIDPINRILATDQAQILEVRERAHITTTDTGFDLIDECTQGTSTGRGPGICNGRNVLKLENGQARFTLLSPDRHSFDHLTITATGSEGKHYKSGENIVGVNVGGSLVMTTKTLKYASKESSPIPPARIKSDTQYGYEYTLKSTGSLAKPGDKMILTLDFKGSLPGPISDGVKIDLLPAYSVFNKNLKSQDTTIFGTTVTTEGKFIDTHAAEFTACYPPNQRTGEPIPAHRTCFAGIRNKIHVGYSGQPIQLELVRTKEPSMLPYLTFEIEAVVQNPLVPKRIDGQYATTVKRSIISIPLP